MADNGQLKSLDRRPNCSWIPKWPGPEVDVENCHFARTLTQSSLNLRPGQEGQRVMSTLGDDVETGDTGRHMGPPDIQGKFRVRASHK